MGPVLGDNAEYPWYTNHTLLPEALERWSVPLFGGLLPRHLEIIYEINRRFLDEVRLRYPGDDERLRRLSLIDEGGERYVRMANLACVGSHAINGVARLHSDLLKETVLRDFAELWPHKFTNVTNGVTPRRFLVLSNPKLAALISGKIGTGWIKRLEDLKKLEPLADQPEFRREWRAIKRDNKRALAAIILKRVGLELNPDSLFDIQVKRLHEYKRQHLNVLHIIALYNRLRRNPKLDIPPRTFIFGGKAAPGYFMAKLIIKLINSVGDAVNNRPGNARPPASCVLTEFQCQNGPAYLPRRRPLGADFDGRQRGLRHRQHEVLPQRGADHRDAGRGECGNP